MRRTKAKMLVRILREARGDRPLVVRAVKTDHLSMTSWDVLVRLAGRRDYLLDGQDCMNLLAILDGRPPAHPAQCTATVREVAEQLELPILRWAYHEEERRASTSATRELDYVPAVRESVPSKKEAPEVLSPAVLLGLAEGEAQVSGDPPVVRGRNTTPDFVLKNWGEREGGEE